MIITSNRVSRLFIIARLLIDILLIPVIFILAYGLKFKVGWVFHNIFSVSYGRVYNFAQIESYLNVIGLIVFLWILAFYFAGLYTSFKGIMPEVDEFVCVVKGVSLATLEVMAVSFIYRDIPGSRYVLFYAWLLGTMLIFTSRIIFHWLEIYLMKKGIGSVNVMVVGADTIGQDVVEKIINFPALRMRYVGTIDFKVPDKCHFTLRNKLKIIGSINEYKSLVEKYNVSKIFVTRIENMNEYLRGLKDYARDKKIDLMVLSNVNLFLSGFIDFDSFDGLPFTVQRDITRFRTGFIFKRLFDLFFSFLILTLLLPLFLVSVLYIKLVSPDGPVFYVQERVGMNNRIFKMLKFRTMVPDAEAETGPVMVKHGNDNRYIKGGSFIRKTSIDELPQLINVLKGEMSLVGPRPERPFFVDNFSREIVDFKLRHEVRGGITGWAQINGRSDLTGKPEHKFKYDLYYIKNWSFIFDIKILLKTIYVVLRGEEAY
ncbi:MAG: sugar transferase [bacterium]|nr:sugar transferase [bacterium]